MLCSICGTQNPDGSKFCMKCGSTFNSTPNMNDFNNNLNSGMSVNYVNEGINQNMNSSLPNINNDGNTNMNYNNTSVGNPINNGLNENAGLSMNNGVNSFNNQPVQNNNSQTVSNLSLNLFAFIIAIILKPITSFKESSKKLDNSKNTIILTIVMAVIMTIANVLKTVINTVREYNFYKGTYSWHWDNIKDFKWFSVIGKNFLIGLGIFAVVALVFYIVSLIYKKNMSYIKSLAIVVSAFIPAIIGCMIVGPLISFIWLPLSILVTLLCAIYSFIILYELINSELALDGNQKVYFNMVCYGVIMVILYFAFTKLVQTNINSPLTDYSGFDISDYFK